MCFSCQNHTYTFFIETLSSVWASVQLTWIAPTGQLLQRYQQTSHLHAFIHELGQKEMSAQHYVTSLLLVFPCGTAGAAVTNILATDLSADPPTDRHLSKPAFSASCPDSLPSSQTVTSSSGTLRSSASIP